MENLKELVDYGIIGMLFLMSFFAVGFAIERYMFYKKVDLKKYREKNELEIDLSNNLSIIATIGSNAPYIGLLGTVLGIMLTFYAMGQTGMVQTKEIMIGLALALKATAMGLIVAIPSTVFYNLLVRKMEVLVAKWEILNENEKI
ncbi:TonB-system energizer ExbB [Nitrosophilus alvini]|uniref:TonB-system energizer ExbB n=1 Tax=Nitrosophilus alvini TaxID=2714855 RepID=UPI001F2D9BFE|nr:TonB-system energizer ExbB [Nitrosophilus alvini]